MSYTLTPVVVDLTKVKYAMGSKDAALVQAVMKQHRKGMLEIDSIFDGDEKEIRKEYKAFSAGDFSRVNLNAVYDECDEDQDEDEGDGDEELNAEAERFKKALAAAKTKQEQTKIKDEMKQFFLQKAMETMQSSDFFADSHE